MTNATFDNEEIERYSRHLVLPQMGLEGQKKLKESSVLVIGAGGLGSPTAMYLAAAGIGRLGLVDYDRVDLSNLQRQIIHGTSDIDRPKLKSAAKRLQEINPHVQLDLHETALDSSNALQIFAPYDVIIDGTDNFPTRYLTNDACVFLGKPNVYGSIFRFDGQASLFYAEQGACYRCLFPKPPPPGLVPSCAEGGVLGVLPGIIGSIQATEALKYLLGIGDLLIGRLLLYDALSMSFDEVKLRKNPNCVVCGENPTVTELIDYEQFCGMPAHDREITQTDETPMRQSVRQITPLELKARLEAREEIAVLDVREPIEWDIVNLEQIGAKLIPQGELLKRLDEIDPQKEWVIYCRSGARSAAIVGELQRRGYGNLWNLDGGILRWGQEIDPTMPRY